MGPSARASRVKKNNAALKKKVFGPVEQARSERLSAKLLALAQAPKIGKTEAEPEAPKGSAMDEAVVPDVDMADGTAPKKSRSKREVKRLQEARAQRQERKSRKRPRNQVAFASKKRGGKR